ncbi:GNAT family N-acetyltransferase [Aquidulcibacter sp.]|uniref:GNAT family N-acetyltransferase n=1 Tax=Aquidulcibacter sp. TaxID=2052990 RepID=UPI0025C67A02|nr:GNAT family N-acetyltransferase [Aquidulcibacter sp.]MCA3692263.1 GNAT family N-acetyltransferase [Aquidulcibacter sp.]
MKITTISADALTDGQIARWAGLQQETQEFGSPLVGPYFAQLIQKHRGDVQVAIATQDGRDVAFFAFHRVSHGYVRPVGAPFSDYQAVVSEPGVALDGTPFLAEAGIERMAVSGLMDPYGLFAGSVLEPVLGYRIGIKDGGAAKMERLRQANPKWAKNLRRLANKMDRELGPIRFITGDQDPVAFEAVLQLKIDQYHESGLTDVLRPAWVKAMMHDLFSRTDPAFGGCLITLYAGDYMVSGQFGVRQGGWFHPWIASSCPKAHPYSPGIVFLGQMIRYAETIGIDTIDLAQGHSHYKSQFSRNPVTVQSGQIGRRAIPATAIRKGPIGIIQKRLDLIASVEPDLAGRLHAGWAAVASAPRRLLARGKAQQPDRVSLDD